MFKNIQFSSDIIIQLLCNALRNQTTLWFDHVTDYVNKRHVGWIMSYITQ